MSIILTALFFFALIGVPIRLNKSFKENKAKGYWGYLGMLLGISFLLYFAGGILLSIMLDITVNFAIEIGTLLFITSMLLGEEIIISKITKDPKKKKSLTRIIFTFFGIILVVVLVLYGFDFFKESSCKPPQEIIGGKCCIPSETSKLMCQEDEEKFIKKIETAAESQVYTDGSRIYHQEPRFSFVAPPDYLLIKDVPIAEGKIPYYLIGDEGESGLLEIKVLVMEFTRRYSINEFTDSFIKGLQNKGAELIKKEISTTDTGIGIASIVLKSDIPWELPEEGLNIEPPIYIKGIVFNDELEGNTVAFIMTATENYFNEFEAELDQMAQSFKFG